MPGHPGQQQLLSLQLCLPVRKQEALVALQVRILLTSVAEELLLTGVVPGHTGQQQLLSLQLCLPVRQQEVLVTLQVRILLTSVAERDPENTVHN